MGRPFLLAKMRRCRYFLAICRIHWFGNGIERQTGVKKSFVIDMEKDDISRKLC